MTTKNSSDVLLHPVRLRVVVAISGRELTTSELATLLPDVAQATLYRHIARLVDAGVLEVADERQVRGVVERTYRLATDEAVVDAQEAAAMTSDEHVAGFITFTGTLIDAFSRYAQNPAASFGTDPVGYRTAVLWLSEAEADDLVAGLTEVLQPFLEHEPSPERSRLQLSSILIPDLATPGD